MLTNIAWAMAPAQGQGTESGGSTIMSFLPLILILIVVYILSRKGFFRKKEASAITGERHYKTAFTIAKISEIGGWAIIAVGFIIAVSLGFFNSVALGAVIISVVLGIFCIFQSQLILIVIDTENNTRQVISELKKANMLLKENADVKREKGNGSN
ncbi:MAG: hypothetical protein Q8K51_11775 [Nitrospirota bacterium]|nr:hypothetical protein [Nitrospirota bacterium]